MNLQRLIDQHPAMVAAIFPIYFLCLWFLVGAITSFIGGWYSLARVYRTRVPFNGVKWSGQSGQMRWLANYNRVLTLGASQDPGRELHPLKSSAFHGALLRQLSLAIVPTLPLSLTCQFRPRKIRHK